MPPHPRSRIVARTLVFVGLLLLVTPARAHAYLDPATGSLILQVIAAGVLTAWFTVKGSWSRVKSFFTKMLRRSE